jgi:Rrf2 family protein
MLSLTRKTDYALVALAYLAGRRAEGTEPVSAKQIAKMFGLPVALLMNILKELVQAGVLCSTRGSRGGYELAGEPGRITLLEIVTAMEGPMRLAPCTDGLPIVGQGCRLSEDCPIRGPVRSLHRRINRFLEEVTLKDLWEDRLEEAGQGEAYATTAGTDCRCRITNEVPPDLPPDSPPDSSPDARADAPQDTPSLAQPMGVEIYQGA